jgi:hypothetical protein
MTILKQKQVNQFIFNVRNKIKNDFPLAKYTSEEFAKVLNIPNNEELIVLAYYDLRNNNQLKWNKIALILNKNKEFIVFEYLN